MPSDRPEPKPKILNVAVVARAQRPLYIPPAQAAAVIREQMNYLLDHVGPGCRPGCPDCLRLAHIEDWLLLPFSG